MSMDKKFQTWKEDLEDQTMFMSSINEMTSIQAYKNVIESGEESIPYIMEELDEGNHEWFWFAALHEITNENPIPEDHAGKLDLIARDWLRWGENEGYIDKA